MASTGAHLRTSLLANAGDHSGGAATVSPPATELPVLPTSGSVQQRRQPRLALEQHGGLPDDEEADMTDDGAGGAPAWLALPDPAARSAGERAAASILKALVLASGMQCCADAAVQARACGGGAVRLAVWVTMCVCVMWAVSWRLGALFSQDSLAWMGAQLLGVASAIGGTWGGWYMTSVGMLPVWVRAQGASLEPAAASDRRVHAVDTLPRGVLLSLAGASLTTLGMHVLLIVSHAATGTSAPAGRYAFDLGFQLAVVGADWSIHFALAALLAAHSLQLARHVHQVALELPGWPTETVVRVLRREEALLHTRMHTRALSSLIFGAALLVIVSVCYVAVLFSGGFESPATSAGTRHGLFLFVMVFFGGYSLPPLLALFCVSEVTEGWLAVLHALHNPQGVDMARCALGSQLTVAWQRGRLGVRVFGVAITRVLVLKGLLSVGTLLGLLLRLQPQSSNLSDAVA